MGERFAKTLRIKLDARDEITQRILQKVAPIITKYCADNGYGLIIDASAPWPQGPAGLFAAGMSPLPQTCFSVF